jgi:hypothetical protein
VRSFQGRSAGAGSGEAPSRLHRRRSLRNRLPAGSSGIAGRYEGRFYPGMAVRQPAEPEARKDVRLGGVAGDPVTVRHHRRQWRFMHLGWLGMLAVLLGAALGLFGDGPLARAVAESPGGRLRVEYDRFVRAAAPVRLTIRVGRDPGDPRVLRLRFGRDYVERLEVQSVLPLPVRTVSGPDGFTLEMAAEGARVTVLAEVQFERMGWVQGRVEVVGGDRLDVAHLVYP